MTDEKPHTPPPNGGPMLTRRSALKTGAGALAGGAVLSGADVGPLDGGPVGDAEAVAPLVVGGLLAAGAVGGGVATYLGIQQTQPSEQEVDTALVEEAHARVYSDMVALKGRADSHIETFSQIDTLVRDHIRQNITWRIDKSVAEGLSKSETITAVEDEVETTVQGWMADHLQEWNELVYQAAYAVSTIQAADSSLLDKNGAFDMYRADDTYTTAPSAESWSTFSDHYPDNNGPTTSYTLPDTTTIDVKYSYGTDNFSPVHDLSGSTASIQLRAFSRSGNEIIVLDSTEWYQVLSDLETMMSEEKTNASSLVDQLYDPIANDQIDTSTDIQSARELESIADEASTYNELAASYRAYNMPEAQTNCEIEVRGMLLEGILFRSVADSTLSTGTTIRPEEEPGTIEISGKVKDRHPAYGPNGVDPTTISLDIKDTAGEDASSAEVQVLATDAWTGIDDLVLSATADSTGHAEIVIDGRFDATDVEITINSGITYTTQIEHGGSSGTFTIAMPDSDTDDRVDDSPIWDRQRSIDSLLLGEIQEPFVVTRTGDGSGELQFAQEELISPDPDGDAQSTYDRLKDAYVDEQESQQAVDDLLDEALVGGGGGGGGFLDGIPTIPGLTLVESAIVAVAGLIGINLLTD